MSADLIDEFSRDIGALGKLSSDVEQQLYSLAAAMKSLGDTLATKLNASKIIDSFASSLKSISKNVQDTSNASSEMEITFVRTVNSFRSASVSSSDVSLGLLGIGQSFRELDQASVEVCKTTEKVTASFVT